MYARDDLQVISNAGGLNRYFGAGCDDLGADCEPYNQSRNNRLISFSNVGTSANCPTAFHKSTDTNVQVACQGNNVSTNISRYKHGRDSPRITQVGLAITFCD